MGIFLLPSESNQHVAICTHNRILLTGKYLNAIRECGLTVSPPNARPVESTHNEREVIERVEAVHGWANAQLLDLIVHKSELISHLRFSPLWPLLAMRSHLLC
jgi:hypothetical protein